MTDDPRHLSPDPLEEATKIVDRALVRRRWAIAAPFIAYAVYSVAVPFGAGSPAGLSFGVVCSAFLLIVLLATAWLVAGRGRPVVRIADLPAWFTTVAMVWTVVVLAATVILLAI
jgi:hypothetical protein